MLKERAIRIGKPVPLAAVVTEPAAFSPRLPALLLLNSGVMHHVGSCRMSVKLARAADNRYLIDPAARTATVAGDGGLRVEQWPDDLAARNVEGIGFSLLEDYPGAIEIAGVILLMAMLGAVVLARKQAQSDEEQKAAAAANLARGGAP